MIFDGSLKTLPKGFGGFSLFQQSFRTHGAPLPSTKMIYSKRVHTVSSNNSLLELLIVNPTQ